MQTDEETLDSSRYTPEEIRLFEEEVLQGIKQELWSDRVHALQSFSVFPKQINEISEKLRAFLLSLERTIFYDAIAKKFSFSQEQRQKIGRVVWHCVLEKKWESLAVELEKQLRLSGDISRSIAETIYVDFASFAKKVPSSESVSQTYVAPASKNILSLSLVKALEKYPRILHERITDADIVFRGSDGPVVPNVKNWITAYHQEAGSGGHSAFERSEFLFHNDNAKKLSLADRNVLSRVLQSLDEGTELPINAEAQTIDLLAMREDAGTQGDGAKSGILKETSDRRTEEVATAGARASFAPKSVERVNDRTSLGNTFSRDRVSTPRPRYPAMPEKGDFSIASQDYTDYYPIPKETKTPVSSTVSRISFSSSHMFPTERKDGPNNLVSTDNDATTPPVPASPVSVANVSNPSPAQQTQKKRLIIG